MTPEEIEKLPYRPCAGVMLVNEDGKVFVGQRIDSEYDAWQMPQGGIDEGEAPRDAALRELWEETGVKADLVTVDLTSLLKKTLTSLVLQSTHTVDRALTISFKLEFLPSTAVQHSFVDKSCQFSRLLVFHTTTLHCKSLVKPS